MVRADLLDAVDEKLRRYRDYSKPFGGVQLLMIGDLHQLPPVVKEDEWRLLSQHYQTPYFFGSLALRQSDPVTIELKHIFRQSDEHFIGLLNKVRDNQLDASILETLNSRYVHNFQPSKDEGYITLTSHNAAAHEINGEKLAGIPEPSHFFKAEIKGEFPQFSFPTEETLEFKVGAQVMYVKNDSPEKRNFNGKIGVITRIEEGFIYVRSKGENEDIAVSPVEWKNVRYTLDEATKIVKEEEIGVFKQYPLKLAWAITIHKSQGLTFERAIIDAQAAFAHGQVYVALSRCKSFEGIVLRSKIQFSSVKTDGVVKTYTEEAERNAPDENHLHQSKRVYQQDLLLEMFSFKEMRRQLDKLNRLFLEHPGALTQAGMQHFQTLCEKARDEVFTVADKFVPHLRLYFSQAEMPEEHAELQARTQKAGAYFSEKLKDALLPEIKNLHLATDNKTVIKAATEHFENLE
ncbi:MAG: helicase, partial [Bacteroidota bacterium]